SYLIQKASEITYSSDTVSTLQAWETIRPQRYREFIEMMGIDRFLPDSLHSNLNVQITGIIQKDGYRIEKLYFEPLPKLFIRGNLYIPDSVTTPRPAILYASGHAIDQKGRYQAHPVKFAKLGFVCLLFETIQFGEVWGEHWGPVRNGWFNWYSRGYNPGGVELWNGIRAIDLLCSRKEVDTSKIGVTGISGGGSQSWYIAAADPRVKAAAPVCGAGTLSDHVLHRTVDGHCDCMMPNNIYQQDFKDIGALIAPRPLLIAQADQDPMYRMGAVKELAGQVHKMYNLYGQPNNVQLVQTPGEHSYHAVSRKNIFAFFLRHLAGKNVSPDEAGDIDTVAAHNATPGELRVYVNGLPKNDRTKTIQHTFTARAAAPVIHSKSALDSFAAGVRKFLVEKTFRAFPADTIPFDPKLEITGMNDPHSGNRIFSFNTEKGWRLKTDVNWFKDSVAKKPLVIVLRNYDEERWGGEAFASQIDSGRNVAYIELRGVGETGWEPSFNWHLRRAAAWTGRTIPSMQVYDLLRAINFYRTLPNVDANNISIAAQREMSVIALYAAFLDGKCAGVIIKDPIATQDRTSPVDGKDVPVEMLNCLQVTDVNQLPALILPARTRFMGNVPVTYNWSKEVIKKFGNQ
ncbi:MAG: acetylxylan esterase, partial [Chitinophagaceae bacterium]|nr:acetylxylan esterase [Chitinophagaceae bacterium]